MKLLRVFRTPSHQRFEYKPRHWNPRKEELQQRLEQIEKVKQSDPEALKARIAQNFRRGSGVNTKARQQAAMRSNMLLLVIIVVLGLLSYVLLTVYLPGLAGALGSEPGSLGQ